MWCGKGVSIERKRKLARVVFTVLAIVIAGCGARRPAPRQERPTPPLFVYVSGVAAAHYCTCARWPISWGELSSFDDALHALAVALGEEPMKRVPWAAYAESQVEVSPDQTLLLSLRREGTEDLDIRVPNPQCSETDPRVAERLCAGSPR